MKKQLIALACMVAIAGMPAAACLAGEAQGPASSAGQESLLDKITGALGLDPFASIPTSTDKHVQYVKNYVGLNLASIGYASLGGDRLDTYGAGHVELIMVTDDGTYLAPDDEELLDDYEVTAQDVQPGTEIRLEFMTDSDGEEYDNLVSYQSIEQIVLKVSPVGSEAAEGIPLTEITPSPDRYTYYIRNYVGRNLAACGYQSLGGDYLDEYGAGHIELVIVADDGSFVDPSDGEQLQQYAVIAQSIEPNTELKLELMTDSNGEEYDNLVSYQSIEEIQLYVTRVVPAAEQA